MVIYNSFKNPKLTELIKKGGIGVIPTDTIYGLVAVADDADAVAKIYEIKGRDTDKPLIILLPKLKDLERFGVSLSKEQVAFLKKYWPGKLSVVLKSTDRHFDYLAGGKEALTFRLPDDGKLISLLQKTGPLVAPSANPQGLNPASNADDAVNYFLGEIDFLVDGGEVVGESSTLVDLTKDTPVVLRQGPVKIS